jgi:hypothetical protein
MSNKLIEALKMARRFVYASAQTTGRDILVNDRCGKPCIITPKYALEKIDDALAKPPRNCDVGTEYEQSDRFAEFCRHHEKGCGLGYGSKGIGHPKVTCPAFKNIECSIVWAQMPYESEVK